MEQLELLRGHEITSALAALAALRIEVFREYPYLYEGAEDYEARYLARYAQAPGALVILARDPRGAVIGASTALPLADELEALQRPFVAAGYDLGTICYFGESLLRAPWRGRGLGGRFFDLREGHARALGLTLATFCAVERPDEHPLRPASYRPLDGFWGRRGYARSAALVARLGWQDVGDADETEKPMRFWTRSL